MQSQPLQESFTITYKIQRNLLVRIWWRRMFIRPRILITLCVMLLFAAVCLFEGSGFEMGAYIIVGMVIVAPINIYRAVAKAVDNDPQWTDQKTVEFSATRIVATGPNWKNEIPWTRFRGFSEDTVYFYLHLSNNGLASVVPKSELTPEQQKKLRDFAKTQST